MLSLLCKRNSMSANSTRFKQPKGSNYSGFEAELLNFSVRFSVLKELKVRPQFLAQEERTAF